MRTFAKEIFENSQKFCQTLMVYPDLMGTSHMKELIQQLKDEGKKVLYLPIKQKYFDAIMAGRKKQEFREVRPQNVKKYIQLDEEGYEVEDEYHNAIPIHYDYIHFAVGYAKERDEAVVAVESEYSEIFVDDNNNPIEYELEDGRYFVAELVVYNLGEILKTKIISKNRRI